MISERTQQLTAQFYEWELLGRGWLCANEPVDLEPTFTPFFGHFINRTTIVDDGIRHTLLSSIASTFKKKKLPEVVECMPEVSHDLFPFVDSSILVTLQLIIPKQVKVSIQDAEQLLTMLSYCTRPISFEIIGTQKEITIQFVCREEDALYIKSQLVTFFKGIAILEKRTDEQSLLSEETSLATIDFGLQEEFMRPLTQGRSSIDPFTGMFSILEHLHEGEQVVFQVLFNGVVNHWGSSIIKSVSDANGGSFFEDAPEMLPLAKEKIGSTLCTATIRFLTQAETLDTAFALLRKLTFALITNSKSQSNALIPLTDTSYNVERRIEDILFRESCRAGMLLNAKELATFIHIPDATLISKKLIGDNKKTKAAPRITEGYNFTLGINSHNGIEKKVTISNEQRVKHTHIIGTTGTGKSTLLLNMICQDIEHGEGVAVLDPHGDLIDTILSSIPSSRIHDVLLIDPSDSEFPVGFNILKAHSDIEKEVLSSDLVAAFRKLSTSWGDQMNSVFANAILAFLESTKEGTLIDIRRFLIEKAFREEFLKSVVDPSIRYYWQKEYPLLKTNSIGPILTRLDAFLRPRMIRNMVAQKQGIDFEKLLNTKKILLVKLSQGLIGSENSYLLGTFVVSKIHQAAFARQIKQERSDFFVYIDEFQHFITASMAHILSGARKYHVGLILAHQDLQQLQKSETELLNTLIANAGTRICFRLGDADAKKMAEGFSFFEPHDLQNLDTGEAIVRIERPEFDFSLSTFPFQPASKTAVSKDAVVSHSRNSYSASKQSVETALKESMSEFEVYDTKQENVIKSQGQPIPDPEKTIIIESPQEVKTKSVFQPEEKEMSGVIKKKEETQHRYLQTLIKKMAEAKGYKATIEMPTPNNKGSIDVHIVNSKLQIACEVSVTTDSNWELHNIEKCLIAGYDLIFVCCAERKAIDGLQKKVLETFEEVVRHNIIIGEPEVLFELLDRMAEKQAATETTIKGYRVKVEYDAISNEAMKKKRESIAKLVIDAMKKFKK